MMSQAMHHRIKYHHPTGQQWQHSEDTLQSADQLTDQQHHSSDKSTVAQSAQCLAFCNPAQHPLPSNTLQLLGAFWLLLKKLYSGLSVAIVFCYCHRSATLITSLPRTCPASEISWAFAASESGSTWSIVTLSLLSFIKSTS
jgi:hypothetical protein